MTTTYSVVSSVIFQVLEQGVPPKDHDVGFRIGAIATSTSSRASAVVERLLHVDTFARMMELLDVALLDAWFLRFYPSAIAAAVFAFQLVCRHPVVDADVIKHITGYELDQLVPCMAILVHFDRSLPFQGMRPAPRLHFDLKVDRFFPCDFSMLEIAIHWLWLCVAVTCVCSSTLKNCTHANRITNTL